MSSLTEKQYDQFWAVCEGTATREEVAAFEQWIHGNLEARREYVRYVALYVDLQWDDLAAALPDPDEGAVLPKIEVEPADFSRRRKRFDSIHPQRHRVRFNMLSVVLTALAWIGFGYFVIATTTPDESRTVRHGEDFDFVARITGQHEHRWAASTRGIPWRAFLAPGERLHLLEGLVEITYYDGAVVVLEGPAEFVVDSLGAGTLELGRLSVHVGPGAEGFVVDTPRARFTDLGTEFGVSVDRDGHSTLHVYLGRVEVNHNSQTYLVDAGNAVRVSRGQVVHIAAASESFQRSLPQPPRPAAIAWGPATDMTGPDDILSEGIPVTAVNEGGEAVTVNGVEFIPGETLGESSPLGLNGHTTGDTQLDVLLNTFTFGGGQLTRLAITGLVPGRTYKIQVIYCDGRTLYGNRSMTFGSGQFAQPVTLSSNFIRSDNPPYGQFAVGTFTAVSETQLIEMMSPVAKNVHLTAFIVRELPAADPAAGLGEENESEGRITTPPAYPDTIERGRVDE